MNKKIKDLVEDDKVLISFEKEDKHYYGLLCRPNIMFPTWVKVRFGDRGGYWREHTFRIKDRDVYEYTDGKITLNCNLSDETDEKIQKRDKLALIQELQYQTESERKDISTEKLHLRWKEEANIASNWFLQLPEKQQEYVMQLCNNKSVVHHTFPACA